jgi:hypothetical protein
MSPRPAAIALAVTALIAGCGSGSAKHGAGTGSVAAEAKSAATGDIPDNQVFLTFRDRSAGYSIKYPEGWSRTGRAGDVTFRDKDNVVHIVVGRRVQPLARVRARSVVSIHGERVQKVTYTTLAAPNPVTGKRPQLVVDRYVFARGRRVAAVDLSTPKGVDNVDAYRMISRSFRWQ